LRKEDVNNNRLFKLSPSDFKYLWEDCKHCYYRKVVHGVELPSIGMPNIFTKMNTYVQTELQGTSPKNLHPDLPDGLFELQERYLKSISIPSKNICYISGRFDILTKFNDGTHGVIDLKITDPKEESIYKFRNQLHAYKFALENPSDESKRMVNKISKMGLLVISPKSVRFHKGHMVFISKPVWIGVEENMDEFFAFIDEVSQLLEGDVPKPTENCKWCVYRTHFSTNA